MPQQLQLIADLKTSRETAERALSDVYSKITRNNGNDRAKSSLSYNTVHAICMAIKADGRFYDIYADAIRKLESSISSYHWNLFVELLRYILGEFYSKLQNVFKDAMSLMLLAQVDRIMTSADIKSHLKLYSRQLCYAHAHMSDEDVEKVIACFSRLLVTCKRIEFEDLLEDFYTNFFGLSVLVQNVISKHLAKWSPMFDKFFSAVGAFKIPKERLKSQFILITRTLVILMQLDIADKNTVLSQTFLRSCKENASIKEHKYHGYALNLLYYFVKLLLFPNALDFNRTLLDVLRKLAAFFDRSELSTEVWFMDTIVTFTRILDANKNRKAFFHAIDEQNHVEAFALIEKLIKLSHGINYESGLWVCCNSVRKHVVFRLCLVEMVMFETVLEKGFTKPALYSSSLTILKHALNVADYFKCSTGNYEIGSILNILAQCVQKVKTKEQGDQLCRMLSLSIKAKEYMPDNYTRNLLKYLIHVHKVTGDTQAQAEMCALFIAHTLVTNEDTELIKKYIGGFYSLEPCMSVSEKIHLSTSPLKEQNFNRRFLHSLEVAVYSKMRDPNILVVTSLLKTAETFLEFTLTARQYPTVNVSSKLDRKYAEINEKSTKNAMDYLALGHICKMRAVQQMDELKNLFSIPKISEESLLQIHDVSKLKSMDLGNEVRIVKLGMESIESFQKFFATASHQSFSDDGFFVDWEAIVDDIAMLARLFHFRGYLDYAYISWRLLLDITTWLHDILNQIRALSFICNECQFIERYDPRFDFDAEIQVREKGIYESLTSMEFLTPRRQNYVLVCLCHIAWYYAHTNRFRESDLLLDLALGKVNELVDRGRKFELVRATHLSVVFRIQWKLQRGMSNKKAFHLVDRILDEIRAAVYFTSEDSLNFPILLFDLVNDITEFTINRLSEPATTPYVQMVLKLALDVGAAYRLVQFLIVWTHINLQTENIYYCQIKLDIIDMLFRNAQLSKTKVKYSNNGNLKCCADSLSSEFHYNYEDEPVRKAVHVMTVSPVRIKYQPPADHRDIDAFLLSHDPCCTCDKCSHIFLAWQFFRVGCLNARLLYLGDLCSKSEQFFAKAKEWCKKPTHNTPTKFLFREYELYMMVHHMNVLRQLGYYDATLTLSKASKDIVDEFRNALDGVYDINFAIQSESAISESQKTSDDLKVPARRLLKFSPIERPAPEQAIAIRRRGNANKKHPIVSDDNESSETTPTTQKSRPRNTTKRKENSSADAIDKIVAKHAALTHTTTKQTLNNAILITDDDDDSSPTSKTDQETEVTEICRKVELIQLNQFARKKTVPTRKPSKRPNLNNAIMIIEDDDESPKPTITRKTPKSASKAENTSKPRGRLKKWPTTVVDVDKTETSEARTRSHLRRRI